MQKIFEELSIGFDFERDSIKDSINFLKLHKKDEVAEHSHKVALEAERLADRFGIEKGKALTAGYLHDIGNIIPYEEIDKISIELGIQVLPEEKVFSPILHQKISKAMAVEIFRVNDAEILKAIEYHTTLKGNPSKLDMILFIADKMQWDKEHSNPFIAEVLKGIEISLEKGVFAYVKYGYDNKNKMKVLHPWFVDAYNYYGRVNNKFWRSLGFKDRSIYMRLDKNEI